MGNAVTTDDDYPGVIRSKENDSKVSSKEENDKRGSVEKDVPIGQRRKLNLNAPSKNRKIIKTSHNTNSKPTQPPKSRPNAPQTKSNKFEISIAIDFGTDGLGVAYALPNTKEIYVHDKWKSKQYGTIAKPKTIILFDDQFETVAVGLDAKHVYINLSSSKKKQWMLFERFKMSLFEEKMKVNDTDEKTQNIAIESEIVASNGKKCASEKVFIATFKHINDICKKYLKKQKIKNVHDNIQWIITVPAIWNDESKNKMKNWAEKAGLINADLNNHCKIVYEPDCASLALLYFMKDASNIHYDKDKKSKKGKKKRRKSTNDLSYEDKKQSATDTIANQTFNEDDNYTLKNGDKYVLIDAGGGTVDVACHEIIAEFGVKEIYHPSGGKWGSTYIDDQYIKMLENVFSKQWMDEFRKQAPNKYVAMIYHFQKAKESFYARDKNNKTHNVQLPFEFLSFIEEKLANQCNEMISNPTDDIEENNDAIETDELVEDFVLNSKIGGKENLLQLEDESLIISVDLWKQMFDFVITPIINHVQTLLQNVPLLMSKHLKYVCLVGGLSCSQYFKYRIKQQFGIKSKYKLEIIVPHKPILSVVQGAAFFGITTNFVRARRLQYSYGVVIAKLKRLAIRDEIPDDHIEEHEFHNEYDNKDYVAGCIKIIATKNEEVQLYGNEVKQMFTRRMDPKHNVVTKKIFCSDMVEPKTINDGKVIGSMNIKFDDENPENMQVVSEFHFSETMLKIFVHPKKTPNEKTELEVNYNMDE